MNKPTAAEKPSPYTSASHRFGGLTVMIAAAAPYMPSPKNAVILSFTLMMSLIVSWYRAASSSSALLVLAMPSQRVASFLRGRRHGLEQRL